MKQTIIRNFTAKKNLNPDGSSGQSAKHFKKEIMLIRREEKREVILWCSGLGIWHCHCCGAGMISGLGTSKSHRLGQKKKKKDKKRKQKKKEKIKKKRQK